MHCKAFAAKGIIQSVMTSCSRRLPHALQKRSFHIGWEMGDGRAQRRQNVIYDCLVATCNLMKFVALDSETQTLIVNVYVPRFRVVAVICWLLLGQGQSQST